MYKNILASEYSILLLIPSVWKLDETVPVVFEILLHTQSLTFEQRLVFRLRCDVQNVVSIILKSVEVHVEQKRVF